MKKALVWILVLALLAVASVLGTIAYLTDEATADNVMTVGKIDIELLEYQRVDTEYKDADKIVEEFVDGKPLLPAVVEKGFSYDFSDSDTAHVKWDHDEEGNAIKADYTSPIWDPAKISNEVDKMVFVRNNGDYNAYVRLFFAFEAGKYATLDDFQENVHLNLNDKEGWEWEWTPFLAEIDGEKYFIAKATYKTELAPDEVTDISLSQIALDSLADNEAVEAFGNDYKVLVRGQGIQSAGFTDPDTALDEGFGDKLPFDDITLATGINLKTALHNLNGDGSTPITSKVATVTFGLNETYPNIVKDNVGTLTSVEQDAMVYTYYVPNATDSTKYDLYVLADSAIYTPKDSTGLFQGMTSLTTVKTTNMDVSRTENMTEMFKSCSALNDLNVSEWKVGNVTSMASMFQGCKAIESLAVTNWDVRSVVSFSHFIASAGDSADINVGAANMALKTLDVSKWQTVSATDMSCMFRGCPNITTLAVDKWDVADVTNMDQMFRGCKSISKLDLHEWDVRNVAIFSRFISSMYNSPYMDLSELNVSGWQTDSLTTTRSMFYGCNNLKQLDLSTWNVSNATELAGMFQFCQGLTQLNLSNWQFGENIENITLMFRRCESLETLNLSGWDTSDITSMAYLFDTCTALKNLYLGDNWDVSNVENMQYMFNGCEAISSLDLSGWNTSKVTNTQFMFNRCSALKNIYVGDGWDMSKVTNSATMFAGCTNLRGGAGTIYDSTHIDKTYAHIDTAENPGYFTHIKNKPAEPEQNQNQ